MQPTGHREAFGGRLPSRLPGGVAPLAVLGLVLAAACGGEVGEATGTPAAGSPDSAGSPAASPGASPTAADEANFQFAGEGDEAIRGTATLGDIGDGRSLIVLDLDVAGGAAEPVFAHLRAGTCADASGEPAADLAEVLAGESTTEVDIPFEELMSEPHAIDLHFGTAAEAPVSCADLAE